MLVPIGMAIFDDIRILAAEVGDGEGVGPPINTDAGLLCTASAVTINTDLPAPRSSAGTRTFI